MYAMWSEGNKGRLRATGHEICIFNNYGQNNSIHVGLVVSKYATVDLRLSMAAVWLFNI